MGVQPISVPQSLASVLNAAGDRNGVDFELVEQLRNLGLAELGLAGIAVSPLGETIIPTTH